MTKKKIRAAAEDRTRAHGPLRWSDNRSQTMTVLKKNTKGVSHRSSSTPTCKPSGCGARGGSRTTSRKYGQFCTGPSFTARCTLIIATVGAMQSRVADACSFSSLTFGTPSRTNSGYDGERRGRTTTAIATTRQDYFVVGDTKIREEKGQDEAGARFTWTL